MASWLRCLVHGLFVIESQVADDLRSVRFHLVGGRIGDEVNYVLPRDHTGPWLGARPSRKVSSKGTVVFTRKEK